MNKQDFLKKFDELPEHLVKVHDLDMLESPTTGDLFFVMRQPRCLYVNIERIAIFDYEPVLDKLKIKGTGFDFDIYRSVDVHLSIL